MRLALAAAFATFCGLAIASASSELKAFRMNDCGVSTCISVEGPQADVSLAQTSLSARNVNVSVTNLGAKQHSKHAETFRCDSFRFDLVTQFLMCDNRESHRPSMTIDRRYTMTKYP